MARVFVTNEAFVAACLAAKSIGEVAKATGLAETTVQQRRVRLRNLGLPIPEFARGGGRKATTTDLTALNDLIAQHTGKSVDEVKAAGAELVAKHAERTADEVAAEVPAETAPE